MMTKFTSLLFAFVRIEGLSQLNITLHTEPIGLLRSRLANGSVESNEILL